MAFDDGDADASCEERPESVESYENRDRVMSLKKSKGKSKNTNLNTPNNITEGT